MSLLLALSRAIDRLNMALGRLVIWLILAATLFSAGNAIMRKAFSIGSNAFLEIQWYLFAATFMLGVGYVLLKNEHVRIDFISARLSKRTNAIIDSAGLVLFTIPLALIMINLGWPVFRNAFISGEMSINAGGLIRWPVMALIPLGFSLLTLQSISELIKRVAFIRGDLPEPFSQGPERSVEEQLAEELAREAAARDAAKLQPGR